MSRGNRWVIMLVVFIAVMVYNSMTRRSQMQPETSLVPGPLAQARQAHPTKLLQQGPSPQEYDNTVPAGVESITYPSNGRTLKAWLMRPTTPGKHPAVCFCHGGFALGSGDDEAPRAFVNAGYVVMLPSWRGENGNPGNFEFFFGEVDDAKAALDYLAQSPDVDASRLYATGHSAGGTMAMLLAEMDPRLRKAAACGGMASIRRFVELTKKAPFDAYYDWKDPVENDLRSAGLHVSDLNCPLKLFYGSDERALQSMAKPMLRSAEKAGKQVTLEVIPNADHSSALEPAVQQMITFFNE